MNPLSPSISRSLLIAAILLMSTYIRVSTSRAEEASNLAAAIAAGNDSLVTVLLVEGGHHDDRLAEYYNGTPLMLAAERNRMDIAQKLLDSGADPDAVDRYGDPALNWASYYGHLDFVKLLVASGADPDLGGRATPLEIAMRRGHEVLARWLAPLSSNSPKADRWSDQVEEAIDTDDDATLLSLGTVRELSAIRDSLGRPLLCIAAHQDKPHILEALLESGLDVDQADWLGMTPLMFASRDSHAEVALALLEAGALPMARAGKRANQLTSLHFAAAGGNMAIVDALVERGAEIDARDADGVVPMLWALGEGRLDVVLRLIELGGDATLADQEGQSVADIANKYGIEAITAVLAKRDR